LAPRHGGIKEKIENGLYIARATRLSEPSTVTEEELLTVPTKPNNIAYESSDDHNMELDEQSYEELLTSDLLPEQNHKQHAKQSTNLRVALTGSLDLQCQNDQTGRSKSVMILINET